VRYATANAFRTAIEQRLLTGARESGVDVTQLRKLVVFDRILARLIAVAPDRWVLKGAVALHYRLGARFRSTKDLDLGRWDGEAATAGDFLAAQEIDLGDYFRFAIERTEKLDTLLEGAAVRYRVSAELAGRRFEDVTVDVGFSDQPVTEPEHLRGSALLSFAGIDANRIPVLRIEPHVAEKLHAYTRQYAGGRPSSRVKDLVDLVLIATFLPIEAGRLKAALQTTFDGRGSHPLPLSLPPPPPDWRAAYAKIAAEVGLDPELAVGYEHVKRFLDPLLGGSVSDDARWNPLLQSW
jgi:predicted nucleotidyltransferase component of viral defense system